MADLKLPSLNHVLIAGRLTRDPDLRYTPSGTAVCNFRLASGRRFKDQSGEWRDDPTFVNVVTWKKTAENCGEYLKKGSAVLVEGRLQSRSWETEDGQKTSVLEIVAQRVQFLDRVGGPEKRIPSEVS
ncbi:single-stranded DNA-binding protein, partial [candidate division TA06 bacterium]